MSEPTNPFAVAAKPAGPETLQSLLAQDKYRKRFEQVLADRAPQFISSILSLGATMPDVEPRSILASAAIAASLDLPVDKNLGFAWIIPYRKGDRKFASFQMGARAYVQLALRTAQYKRMNAKPVNAEALNGYDNIGEPVIDWNKLDETKEPVGYVFAFSLVNGFTKTCYWSKSKVEDHARKYSQAYRAGYDSPWKTHFSAMALKTVIANELRHWGILSVEMQMAFREDLGMHKDIDTEVEFPEPGDEIMRPKFDDKIADAADAKATADEKAEAAAGLAPSSPPPEQPRRGRKKAAAPEPPVQAAPQAPAPAPAPVAQTGPTTATQPSPPSQPAAGATQPSFSELSFQPYNQLRELMDHSKITEPEMIRLCRHRGLMTEQQQELLQLADDKIKDLCESWPAVAGQVRIDRKSSGK
jgi:recombination protein RecT